MTDALDDLIAKVEAGNVSVPDCEAALGINGGLQFQACEAFEGSLDAALALHSAVLPGWAWSVKTLATGAVQAWTDYAHQLRRPGFIGTTKDNPARAWLLAILRAVREAT